MDKKQRYKITVDPTVEPVSLADMKEHLRIETSYTEEDNYISALISAARKQAETYTERSFLETSWGLYLDAFPSGLLEIRKGNIISITSLSYQDENNSTQTLTGGGVDYYEDFVSIFARIFPNDDFPQTFDEGFNNVTIIFKAGYGTTAAEVPEDIAMAIKLIVGILFQNREDVRQKIEMPRASELLLDPYRIKEFV